MHPDQFFGTNSNIYYAFGSFVILWILFDLSLVRRFRLGKVAWKYVDYIWLGFAALGLFGSVAQIRIATAPELLNMYEQRAVVAYDSLEGLVRIHTARPGAICRTFVRSEYSPNIDQF